MSQPNHAHQPSRDPRRPGARPGDAKGIAKPVRRLRSSAKTAILDPEARRTAEAEARRKIEDFLASGKVTKCEPMWAAGAVTLTMFGTEV